MGTRFECTVRWVRRRFPLSVTGVAPVYRYVCSFTVTVEYPDGSGSLGVDYSAVDPYESVWNDLPGGASDLELYVYDEEG